jgi:CelD/BcsL family acetyltransferase involved in cellulose biosynthesis
LQVEILSSVEAIAGIRSEWQSLLAQRPEASPFETIEWMLANVETFRNQEIAVLVFRKNGETAGIVPLAMRESRKYLRRRKWLEFAGLPFADYGACLAAPGQEREVALSLMDFLKSETEPWEGAYLDGLRRNDNFTDAFYRAAQEGGVFAGLYATHRVRRLTRSVSPEHSQSTLQASRSLAKSRKRLAQLGAISFRVATARDEITSAIPEYFAMHAARCSFKGVPCPLASPEQRTLFLNIVRHCAPRGQVWLSSLCCGGRPVASRFSLRHSNALHLYSTCFAPEFAKFSPSMLQLEALLDYAFDHGIEVVDMGIGESPQKERAWARVVCQLARIELYQSRDAYLESRFYAGAQAGAARFRLLRKTGKLVRKALPA